jgi:hypothetical protein
MKSENQLKLESLINQRDKILNTTYPESYNETKRSCLKILGMMIQRREKEVRDEDA